MSRVIQLISRNAPQSSHQPSQIVQPNIATAPPPQPPPVLRPTRRMLIESAALSLLYSTASASSPFLPLAYAAAPIDKTNNDAEEEDNSNDSSSSSSSSSSADSNEEDGSFYSKWTYQKPSDILPFIKATAKQGDTEAILTAIDTFAVQYPMFRSGPEKGQLLETLVKQQKPQLAVELGTFMGYGAIRIARNLPRGGRLISLEGNEQQADVARQIIAYAGLSSVVEVISGLSSSTLPLLAQKQQLEGGGGKTASMGVGFVFLDHCKECYKPDLILMEGLGFIQPGTVVIADNVKVPGAPGYLEHLASAVVGGSVEEENNNVGGGSTDNTAKTQSSCRYKTELIDAEYEVEERYKPNWKPQKDAVSVSYCVAG